MNPTKSESIKRFLNLYTRSDLAELYSLNMECQVNVAQDEGIRTEGEYKGKKWHGWSDGITTWKSFRIPYKSDSDPEYNDLEIKFDLVAHAEAIGLTGWDWVNRVSKWVAFDFDALLGHSASTKTLTQDELRTIVELCKDIPWVTVRKSTSGTGLHLYVFLDDVPTKNHTEHAALARSIIGQLTATVGYDFSSKVDVCGGNMWIWHRKMKGTDGLEVIKKGGKLYTIPENWRDHIDVIKTRKVKTNPQIIQRNSDIFEDLTSQRAKIDLDKGHLELIDWLKENDCMWWWDQDHHMLVTHTVHLKEAHHQLGLKGFFDTIAEGTEKGADHNCFLFPMRKSSWSVRRYTPGVAEHVSWDQDGLGWTRCYYNKDLDLRTACKALGGVENEKGAFIFQQADSAIQAALLLGVNISLNPLYCVRQVSVKQHKDGRLLLEMPHEPTDKTDNMENWLPDNKKWIYISNKTVQNNSEPDIANYDDVVRHLVTERDEDCGWLVKSDNTWRLEPLQHVKAALSSLNLSQKEINVILGSSIFNCWKLVNKPFQSEYPGGREWNRNSAQLKYAPLLEALNLNYPTWLKILNHIGSNLDPGVLKNKWCKDNGIVTGADYLKCWIAALFKEPYEPLPYLFLFGPENSGKSILHEALSLLLTRGYIRADAAIKSNGDFNGELEGAVLCAIEEINVSKSANAHNKIKDWVTSKNILIHKKGKTPYHTRNTTHWIQCANSPTYCPVFTGDTRITVVSVPSLDEQIPKKILMTGLMKEAQDFITEIMNLELPAASDRLSIPIIETEDKNTLQQSNKTDLEIFIDEHCVSVPGNVVQFSEFYEKFVEWLDPNFVHLWSRIIVGKKIPPPFLKGRSRQNNSVLLGNIGWKDKSYAQTSGICYLENGILETKQKDCEAGL